MDHFDSTVARKAQQLLREGPPFLAFSTGEGQYPQIVAM